MNTNLAKLNNSKQKITLIEKMMLDYGINVRNMKEILNNAINESSSVKKDHPMTRVMFCIKYNDLINKISLNNENSAFFQQLSGFEQHAKEMHDENILKIHAQLKKHYNRNTLSESSVLILAEADIDVSIAENQGALSNKLLDSAAFSNQKIGIAAKFFDKAPKSIVHDSILEKMTKLKKFFASKKGEINNRTKTLQNFYNRTSDIENLLSNIKIPDSETVNPTAAIIHIKYKIEDIVKAHEHTKAPYTTTEDMELKRLQLGYKQKYEVEEKKLAVKIKKQETALINKLGEKNLNEIVEKYNKLKEFASSDAFNSEAYLLTPIKANTTSKNVDTNIGVLWSNIKGKVETLIKIRDNLAPAPATIPPLGSTAVLTSTSTPTSGLFVAPIPVPTNPKIAPRSTLPSDFSVTHIKSLNETTRGIEMGQFKLN